MSRALKLLAIFFAFVAIYTLSRHSISPATTTTANQTTTLPTSPTGGTTCKGTYFQGAFNQGQGAAGTIYASITLTKSTSGTCAIKGWPILTLQDRTGAVLPSATVDLPSSDSAIHFGDAKANLAPRLLTMHQESTMTVSLAYSDVPQGNETCGSATSIAVQLTKQGSSVSITPDYPQQPCNHGTIWVSPFY